MPFQPFFFTSDGSAKQRVAAVDSGYAAPTWEVFAPDSNAGNITLYRRDTASGPYRKVMVIIPNSYRNLYAEGAMPGHTDLSTLYVDSTNLDTLEFQPRRQGD